MLYINYKYQYDTTTEINCIFFQPKVLIKFIKYTVICYSATFSWFAVYFQTGNNSRSTDEICN